jgi:hypothetical protein
LLKILRTPDGRFAGWSVSDEDIPSASLVSWPRPKANDDSTYEEPALELSENLMRVYRGLNQPPAPFGDSNNVYDVLKRQALEGLGIHWTTSLPSADYFATSIDLDDANWARMKNYGVVIEAVVDKSHIIPEKSEEWNTLAYETDIFASDEEAGQFEQEVTLRPNAPITVIAQHDVGAKADGKVARMIINLENPISFSA